MYAPLVLGLWPVWCQAACAQSVGGWQLKDWAWHSAPAAGAPWPCVSRLRGVADAVPSHGGAHTVLSVEKELEWKNLGICWVRGIFALFLDNLTKLMCQGVKSVSTDLVCCWLGGLLLS